MPLTVTVPTACAKVTPNFLDFVKAENGLRCHRQNVPLSPSLPARSQAGPVVMLSVRFPAPPRTLCWKRLAIGTAGQIDRVVSARWSKKCYRKSLTPTSCVYGLVENSASRITALTNGVPTAPAQLKSATETRLLPLVPRLSGSATKRQTIRCRFGKPSSSMNNEVMDTTNAISTIGFRNPSCNNDFAIFVSSEGLNHIHLGNFDHEHRRR